MSLAFLQRLPDQVQSHQHRHPPRPSRRARTKSRRPSFERLLDVLLGALASLAELPPEPGTPEYADAMLTRRYAAELEANW